MNKNYTIQRRNTNISFLPIFLLLISITSADFGWSQPCSVNAGSDVTICYGQSTSLTATVSNGSGTIIFNWTSDQGGVYPNNQSITVNPTITTIYTVRLSGGGPCNNETSHVTVNVNPLPVATFTFTPNNQCSPMAVLFANTSAGTMPLTYSWNFGDPGSGSNNTSNLLNPSHTFVSLGGGTLIFNVSLTVTDLNGCSSSITKQVSVKQMPDASIADITGTWKHCVSGSNIAYTLEINNTSSTTSSNTHYHIDWGDLSAPYDGNTLPNGTTHDYTTIGNFAIILTVTNNQCSATKTYYFFNGSNPQGGIVNPGNTQGLCGVPQVISFTFNSTTANNPPGTIYTISYDDGSPDEVYSQPPPALVSHTFYSGSCGHISQISYFPNSFAIKCIISNPCGQSLSVIDPIQISAKPNASFIPNPISNSCINSDITFTSTSSSVGFVDPGTNACTSNLLHTWLVSPMTYTIVSGNLHSTSLTIRFTSPGNYTISLSESSGCVSDLVSAVICVSSPPVSSFSVNQDNGCKPLTVAATGTSSTPNTCNDLQYNWSVVFNGAGTCIPSSGTWLPGSNQTTKDATFTFNDPGTYTITYAFQNSCGTITSTKLITVKAPPKATINSIGPICAGGTVNPSAVFADCYGTISAYNWQFPGGVPSSSTLQTPPAITYLNPGTSPANFLVSVSATNECGLGNVSSSSFIVNPTGQVNQPSNQELCN
ncbi:MAG: PKD domain-containing protein, partial [Bacteroidales bacterium]